MRYLPIELDVRGKSALVVGGGGELVAKIDRLLDAGARVTVVAPGAVDPGVRQRAAKGSCTLLERAFRDEDLADSVVVYVSPEDEPLGARLAEWARAHGRLVCTMDRPESSTFANPAVARASHVVITVATDGTSPGVARRIREDLERALSDPRFARFMDLLGKLREKLPRGERAARTKEALRGFGLDIRLSLPSWVDRGKPDG